MTSTLDIIIYHIITQQNIRVHSYSVYHQIDVSADVPADANCASVREVVMLFLSILTPGP